MTRTNDRSGTLLRAGLAIETREINEQARTVELSFSSEIAVNRWYGDEYLCHDAGCIDFTRINEIGVGLFNHQHGDVLGKVFNGRLDATARVCRATLQFDTDSFADKIFRKVIGGTLRGVSVGYQVAAEDWEEVAAGRSSTNGRFRGPCQVARRWTPMEISIVSVPADATVGVGRNSAAGDYGHQARERELQRLQQDGARIERELQLRKAFPHLADWEIDLELSGLNPRGYRQVRP